MSTHSDPEDELDAILSANCRGNEFGVLSNPLLNLDRVKLRELGSAFVVRYSLPSLEKERFSDAAVLAQNNDAWENPDDNLQLSSKDSDVLRLERENRWHQPLKLYSLIAVCATAAAVQGWDQYGLSTREDISNPR